jgi:hypothetical protein
MSARTPKSRWRCWRRTTSLPGCSSTSGPSVLATSPPHRHYTPPASHARPVPPSMLYPLPASVPPPVDSVTAASFCALPRPFRTATTCAHSTPRRPRECGAGDAVPSRIYLRRPAHPFWHPSLTLCPRDSRILRHRRSRCHTRSVPPPPAHAPHSRPRLHTPIPIHVHTCTSRPCTPRPPSFHARARSPPPRTRLYTGMLVWSYAPPPRHPPVRCPAHSVPPPAAPASAYPPACGMPISLHLHPRHPVHYSRRRRDPRRRCHQN